MVGFGQCSGVPQHACAGPPNSKVGEAIADLAPPHALLNEVGQRQRKRDTEHNHDHRRHAAPQV